MALNKFTSRTRPLWNFLQDIPTRSWRLLRSSSSGNKAAPKSCCTSGRKPRSASAAGRNPWPLGICFEFFWGMISGWNFHYHLPSFDIWWLPPSPWNMRGGVRENISEIYFTGRVLTKPIFFRWPAPLPFRSAIIRDHQRPLLTRAAMLQCSKQKNTSRILAKYVKYIEIIQNISKYFKVYIFKIIQICSNNFK